MDDLVLHVLYGVLEWDVVEVILKVGLFDVFLDGDRFFRQDIALDFFSG